MLIFLVADFLRNAAAEVAAQIPSDYQGTFSNDLLKVQAIVNQINGKNSFGNVSASVPALFGMDYQVGDRKSAPFSTMLYPIDAAFLTHPDTSRCLERTVHTRQCQFLTSPLGS